MIKNTRLKFLFYLSVAEFVAAFLGLVVMAVLIPVPGSPDQNDVSALQASLRASAGVTAMACFIIGIFFVALGLNVYLLRRLRRDSGDA